jgi:hypothetical protein
MPPYPAGPLLNVTEPGAREPATDTLESGIIRDSGPARYSPLGRVTAGSPSRAGPVRSRCREGALPCDPPHPFFARRRRPTPGWRTGARTGSAALLGVSRALESLREQSHAPRLLDQRCARRPRLLHYVGPLDPPLPQPHEHASSPLDPVRTASHLSTCRLAGFNRIPTVLARRRAADPEWRRSSSAGVARSVAHVILLMPRHRPNLRPEKGDHSAGGRIRDVTPAGSTLSSPPTLFAGGRRSCVEPGVTKPFRPDVTGAVPECGDEEGAGDHNPLFPDCGPCPCYVMPRGSRRRC